MAGKTTRGRARGNVRVELLRVYAMLLILVCHATIHLNWGLSTVEGWKLAATNVLIQVGQLGVAIFFMITGYFMVNKSFKPSRLVVIWLKVLTYSVICLALWLVSQLLGPLAPVPLCGGWDLLTVLKKELLPLTSTAYWFMTAYALLLLVSPFLNALFRGLPRRAMLALALGLALSSSLFLLGLPMIPFNGITKAVNCYLVGGCLQLYGQRRFSRVRLWQVALLTCGCLLGLLAFNQATLTGGALVEWLGWAEYYSDGPAVLWIAAAAGTMAWATGDDGHAAGGLARAVVRLAPYTLGVYLLHENFLGHQMLWTTVNRLLPEPEGVVVKLAGLAAVAVGLLLVLSFVLRLVDTAIVDRLLGRLRGRPARLDARTAAWFGEQQGSR